MTLNLALSRLHPMGDQSAVADHGLPSGVNVDSFAGPVHVEWDAGAAMTPLGQVPFFIDFVGSHLGVRISNFGPKKPSNVRISTKNILTFDGSARSLSFKRHRLV
jgi:hypothetical protein